MDDDGTLLRHFAETHDQACFQQVVQRHIGFVYAVARRRLRDPHAAQDAVQAVFIALAQKAGTVARSRSVIGWLHRSAYYETRNIMRAQAHRIARETEAQRLGTVSGDASLSPSWDSIQSVLDDVLHDLSEHDRVAILARYFSNQSYAEIGASLQLSENAARMRVDRALAKLRDRLQRRGIVSTAAVLASALPTFAGTTVPAGMMAAVTRASLSGAAAGAGAAGYFASMSTIKTVAGITLVASIAGFVYEYHTTSKLEATVAALEGERTAGQLQLQAMERQLGELKKHAADVHPAAGSDASAGSTAVAPAKPNVVPGITNKAPVGWHKNGSNPSAYEAGVDQIHAWGGMPSAYVKSISQAADGFGGMMQSASAEAFQNKRVRLTGWIKTENADEGGHLWLRVDGQEPGKVLAFDNMARRAPKGTTDWQEYSVVLDVPANAATLNYGFFINGSGQMWVNGVTIDAVGTDIPTTDLMPQVELLPKKPINLGFAPAPTN